jgi:hypothetical protein
MALPNHNDVPNARPVLTEDQRAKLVAACKASYRGQLAAFDVLAQVKIVRVIIPSNKVNDGGIA